MSMMMLIMLAVGALALMGGLAFAFSGPSEAKEQQRRLTGIKERHNITGSSAIEAQVRKITAGKGSRLDGIAKRYIPNPALLAARIERTGKSWTLGQYMTGSLGLAFVIMALLAFKGLPFLLALLVGLAIGLLLPHMVVGSLIKRRVKNFNKRFPDAIELMVRGLRSGLPISETLGIVASEVPDPVGIEFRGVVDRIRIGRTMDAALQEAADKIGTPEFQFYCITLAIQRETGGNLAETLSNLAEVLRKRAQMKLKIAAMSSESKASAYIIGALPFIVFGLIWFINGNYMQKFFVDQRLILIGLGGLCWMGIGAFIMAQMINFEI